MAKETYFRVYEFINTLFFFYFFSFWSYIPAELIGFMTFIYPMSILFFFKLLFLFYFLRIMKLQDDRLRFFQGHEH